MLRLLKQYLLHIFIIALCLPSLVGAIIYYFFVLDEQGIIMTALISILLFLIILIFIIFNYGKEYKDLDKKYAKKYLPWLNTEKTEQEIFFNIIYFLVYFALFSLSFYILLYSAIDTAIISPWQIVSKYFFIFYSLATLVLFFSIFKKNSLNLLLIILHYFLSFSVCIVVYKIGYGFDPFIHESALDLIQKTGSITPKTFYYTGQYVLEIIINYFSNWSLVVINKMLVPVLAAILLPATLNYAFKKYFPNQYFLALILGLLVLPFSFFIITVPQNLSYLFLILIIVLSLNKINRIDLITIYFLAFTSLVIHPLVGIPAVLFSIILNLRYATANLKLDNKINKIFIKQQKYFYIFIFFLMSIVHPVIFYFLGKDSWEIEKIFNKELFNLPWKLLVSFQIPSQENFILNAIYLIGFNKIVILVVLVFFGILINYKTFLLSKCKITTASLKKLTKDFINYNYIDEMLLKKQNFSPNIYLYSFLSLGIAYLFTRNINFDYLINYERGDYANRILVVGFLFLLPFIFTVFYWFFKKIIIQNKVVQIIFLFFIVLLITNSLYLSYPRKDKFFNSHGFSTSFVDIAAVNWIHRDANNSDYITLANQQVSAASLREFGFFKYYQENIFYYSIPTGGVLYSFYLDMIKNPQRDIMKKAVDLVDVKTAYLVVSKYWWASKKIIAEVKLEADSWQEIENGEIVIFKFIF